MSYYHPEEQEHRKKAYELQVKGGIEGAIKYTIYTTLLVALGHLSWPLFRKQTIPFKGFLISSGTMTGLVIGADSHLLKYEAQRRKEEKRISREVRAELEKQGKFLVNDDDIRNFKRRKAQEELEKAAAAKSTSPILDSKQ